MLRASSETHVSVCAFVTSIGESVSRASRWVDVVAVDVVAEPKTFIGALSQAHEILVHNQWSGAQLRDLKRLFTNDFFRGFGNQTPHLPAASTST